MKRTQFLVFAMILPVLVACNKDDDSTEPSTKPQSNSINKILPLGASRVQGARPEYESYRYELWKSLTEGGYTFDFIGTQSDDASYPSFENANFDVDHEGRGGWTSGQILSELNEWLVETGSPNIVLFSSPGGNDLLDGLDYDTMISNVNAIVDLLQENNPSVTIIIEQLAPGRSDFMTTELTQSFEQIKLDIITIADAQTTSTSAVIPIDMFTGFNDTHLADEVHYNEAGAEFIAERYYDVLTEFLQD
ncbi:MAG: hypothetical protein AAGC47_15255 [Bacteroidota bacterium]